MAIHLTRPTLAACLALACALAAGALTLAGRGRVKPGAPLPIGTALALVGDATTDAAPAPRAHGCGVASVSPVGATMTTKGGRKFHVWGPPSYDPGRAYPLVLTFHGWTSNGRDFEKWFKMEDHVGGAAFTAYPDSRTGIWDFAGASDLDFSAELIGAIADAYCIDRARVLAFGFSYGARFVHHLGCKRPDLVRAIVAGAGGWDKETDCSPMPVLVIHRTRDDDQRIPMGKAAAARWAKVDGCSEATTVTDGPHGCFAYRDCQAGAVTFCEDHHFDATWKRSWNHTVREEYRDLAWSWFIALP